MIQLIAALLEPLFVVVVNMSLAMVVYGGFRYVTSGGDSGNVSNAKNTIIYAIFGLGMAGAGFAVTGFVLPALHVEPAHLGVLGDRSVVTAGFWGGIALFAAALRMFERLPRWIAVYSSWWMPKNDRADHVDDMWAALLEEPSLAARTRQALGLIQSSPLAGLRARRTARRVERAIAVEMRRLA